MVTCKNGLVRLDQALAAQILRSKELDVLAQLNQLIFYKFLLSRQALLYSKFVKQKLVDEGQLKKSEAIFRHIIVALKTLPKPSEKNSALQSVVEALAKSPEQHGKPQRWDRLM